MALHALRLLFERHAAMLARRIMHGIVENGARRLGIRGEAAQDISDLSRCAQMHRAGFGAREQAGHLLHHDTGIAAVAGLDRAQCFHQSCPNSDVLRSEEHTSELQSLMRISYAVFCLKKTKHKTQNTNTRQYST